MLNWIRQKMLNFLAAKKSSDNKLMAVAGYTSERSPDINMENALRFYVLACQGGVVVQTQKYDHRKDRSEHSTYVIPENEDVTQRVAEIVSLELLKN